MSFDWSEYLLVAKELASQTTTSLKTQSNIKVMLLNTISRAYYAAFHQAKAYLEDREGIPYRVDNIHEYVMTRFQEIKHSDRRRCDTISDDLDELRAQHPEVWQNYLEAVALLRAMDDRQRAFLASEIPGTVDEAMGALKTHDVEREKKFAASIEAEKSKKDVLNRKFDELFEKTKGDTSKPIRDIDLD